MDNNPMISMTIHPLKTLPQYFWAVVRGDKTYELRRDDRDFRVGDLIELHEWTPLGGYTGRTQAVEITHILRDAKEYGLMDGYCILSIGPITLQGRREEGKDGKD